MLSNRSFKIAGVVPMIAAVMLVPSPHYQPPAPTTPSVQLPYRHHRLGTATAYIAGAPTSIVVDKGSHTTYVVQEQNSHPLIVFRARNAIGKASTPTPYGQYHVVTKELDPWWYPPPSIPHAPVPPWSETHRNPLGVARIGLDRMRINLHGTNAPGLIGSSVSHGCIRHTNADIMQIFNMVHIGDPVLIVSHFAGAPPTQRSAARIKRPIRRSGANATTFSGKTQ
jgi:lipoprotein-anchoring transpeptidase ErfK/SrfK